MDLDASAIETLSEEIKGALNKVTNVDEILTTTSDDLALAEKLKMEAERSRKEAAAELKHAQEVRT